MSVIFEQVFTLMVFGFVGYILARKNIVKAQHTQTLTALLVYVFSTSNTFRSFSSGFTAEFFKGNYLLLGAGALMLAVLIASAHFGAKPFSDNPYTRYIYEYSLIIPNYSYMGYALAENLLGSAGLISAMVFSMPVNIYIYLIAVCRLSKKPLSPKGLFNAFTIAMLLGMIVGLFQLPIPGVVTSVLDASRTCMAPMSMIIAGIAVSRFKIGELLKNYRIYIIVTLRLVIIPVVFGVVFGLFFPKNVVWAAIIFLAMPCGLNPVVFPELIGEDSRIGAGLTLVSCVFSLVTIPIIFTLFGIGT